MNIFNLPEFRSVIKQISSTQQIISEATKAATFHQKEINESLSIIIAIKNQASDAVKPYTDHINEVAQIAIPKIPSLDDIIDVKIQDIASLLSEPITRNEVTTQRLESIKELASSFDERYSLNADNESFQQTESTPSDLVDGPQNSNHQKQKNSYELSNAQKDDDITKNPHKVTPFINDKNWYYQEVASFILQKILDLCMLYTIQAISKVDLVKILNVILKFLLENQ